MTRAEENAALRIQSTKLAALHWTARQYYFAVEKRVDKEYLDQHGYERRGETCFVCQSPIRMDDDERCSDNCPDYELRKLLGI